MPTIIGSGASSISISGFGNIGTNAKHHLKGCSNAFSPKIADVTYYCFPMNTIDLSIITAERSFNMI
jgi:hypothetical protein